MVTDGPLQHLEGIPSEPRDLELSEANARTNDGLAKFASQYPKDTDLSTLERSGLPLETEKAKDCFQNPFLDPETSKDRENLELLSLVESTNESFRIIAKWKGWQIQNK